MCGREARSFALRPAVPLPRAAQDDRALRARQPPSALPPSPFDCAPSRGGQAGRPLPRRGRGTNRGRPNSEGSVGVRERQEEGADADVGDLHGGSVRRAGVRGHRAIPSLRSRARLDCFGEKEKINGPLRMWAARIFVIVCRATASGRVAQMVAEDVVRVDMARSSQSRVGHRWDSAKGVVAQDGPPTLHCFSDSGNT